MGGVMAVELVPHDPAWAAAAEAEADALRIVLGSSLLLVHHIGSTAIAGIRAKPILDLQVSVSALEPRARCVGPLGITRAQIIPRFAVDPVEDSLRVNRMGPAFGVIPKTLERLGRQTLLNFSRKFHSGGRSALRVKTNLRTRRFGR